MELIIFVFLSSGLLLGWSLGANDAANVFGTAVGSRMIRFPAAAVICGVFVIIGAVAAGHGPADGLGKLGAVNAPAGSFMVALSAGLTVLWMTKLGLPVSTTQAIVGAIVGWNLFSGFPTDLEALARIVSAWIAGPILGALIAFVLYKGVRLLIRWTRPHLLRLDLYTRVGLVLAGAFGAYSLGANNIANVMGVFVESSPFRNIDVFGVLVLTPTEQLFSLGGIAIAVGVFYSRRVMMTVGRSIMPVNPVAAWVVVMAQALVLFVFSSMPLQRLVIGLGLPPIPLVPVSSSQAVVGAVVGIGCAFGWKGIRQFRWSVLFQIASGWISTPILAGVSCYVLLFFLQNVFQQPVYREAHYELGAPGLERLRKMGVSVDGLADLVDESFSTGVGFREALRGRIRLSRRHEKLVLATAEIHPTEIDPERIKTLDPAILSAGQIRALGKLAGRSFTYRWQLADALARQDAAWKPGMPEPPNRLRNMEIRRRLDYVFRTFRASDDRD